MNAESPRGIGYYVYALARAWRQPRVLPAEGIFPQTPVYTVAYRDLLAVVSPVSLAEFEPSALDANLRDADWATARVLAHQRVLSGLLGGYTLVPFKLCTIYSTEERVQEMLAQHYEALDEALGRLDGAIEWGVKLYCDRRLLAEWVLGRSEALQSQRDSIARVSAGAGYFLRRKLEQAAHEDAEGTVDACVELSHACLGACARQAVANPVQPQAVHGRKAEMILNAAYLVDEAELGAFRMALATLEETYAAQGFEYELTGPWPPYNFAALELALP